MRSELETNCKLLAMPWDLNANHKTRWFVESPCTCSYKYAKYDISPKPFFPEPKELSLLVEKITKLEGTNCVNANLYDDQYCKVGFHRDSEQIFQAEDFVSDIISVSLGATRCFSIRCKADGNLWYDVDLAHGDILTMEGLFQKYWEHALVASPSPCAPRINLTFRKLVQHRQYCSLAEE